MGLLGQGKGAPRVVGFDFAALDARAGAWVPPPREPEQVYAAVVAAPVAYPEPAPQPWGTPVPGYEPAKRSRLRPLLLTAFVAAVLVGVPAAERASRLAKPASETFRPPQAAPAPITVRLPGSVGGAPRLTTAAGRKLETSLANDVKEMLNGTKVAVYGHTRPEYALLTVPAGGFRDMAMYDKFATGLRASGAHTGTPQLMNGVTCGAFTVELVRASACAWSTRRTSGLVVWYGHDALTQLAAATKTTITRIERA